MSKRTETNRKQWLLSTDRRLWTELDRRGNNYNLMDKYATANFKISNASREKFRFFWSRPEKPSRRPSPRNLFTGDLWSFLRSIKTKTSFSVIDSLRYGVVRVTRSHLTTSSRWLVTHFLCVFIWKHVETAALLDERTDIYNSSSFTMASSDFKSFHTLCPTQNLWGQQMHACHKHHQQFANKRLYRQIPQSSSFTL